MGNLGKHVDRGRGNSNHLDVILNVVVQQAPQRSDFIRPDIKADNSCNLFPVALMQARIAYSTDQGQQLLKAGYLSFTLLCNFGWDLQRRLCRKYLNCSNLSAPLAHVEQNMLAYYRQLA